MFKKDNRWLTLVIVLIGFFMILLDTTIVNVSIPTIIASLNASLSQVEWIISGYSLSFAALLITFGRMGDLYGRRKLFVLGLIVFTMASVFSGEAQSATILIVARLFQGVGGAMLSPATLSIISSTFRGKERATAFGVFGAISGIAAAVGPVLGGWLTTYHSWRWVFRVNIPIGILGVALALLFVPDTKSEQTEGVDIGGMITSGLGFFFLVFGLIEGQTYGWWKPVQAFTAGSFTWGMDKPVSIIVVTFILSIIFLAWFSYLQIRKTNLKLSPAVNFDFFHSKAFSFGLITIAILALGEFSSLFTLPIFLQSVRGFTPLESGYATLPLALSVMVGAPISAVIVSKIGSKAVITVGITLEAIGLFLISRLTADTTYISLVPALMFLGFGIGLAIAQNTQVILSEINPMHAGSASGVLNTVRQVGTALGIAVVGAVLAHQAAVTIPKQINAIDSPLLTTTARQAIATSAGQNSVSATGSGDSLAVTPQVPAATADNPTAVAAFKNQVAQLGADIKKAIDTGLASAIAKSVSVGALFVLLGALCSLLIPNIPAQTKKEDLVG